MFANDETLQKHLKFKHVDRSIRKKWACKKCNYLTTYKGDLKVHAVTHSNIRAHKCDSCEKCSNRKSTLTKHINSVHNTNWKYECDVCKKIFTKSYYLRVHTNTVHEKFKLYVCTECKKTFGL